MTRRMKRRCCFALAAGGLLGLSGCAAVETSYRAYGGPDRPPGELAILAAMNVTTVRDAATGRFAYQESEDRRHLGMAGWAYIHLLPGRYEIAFSARIGKRSGTYHHGIVEFQAGRRYAVRVGLPFFSARTYAWLVDLESGEVLLGVRP